MFRAYQCSLLVENDQKRTRNANQTPDVYIGPARNRGRHHALVFPRRAGARRGAQGRRSRDHAGLEPRHAGRRESCRRVSEHRAQGLGGGSADVADKVQVHEMATNNGVMTMRPLDKGLAIEPGKTVKLAPGGYHLMMFDLKGPLKQGEKVPVTLEFEKAGKVNLSLDVQGVGAQAPSGADHSGD